MLKQCHFAGMQCVKTLIEYCLKRDDNHAKEVHFRLWNCNDLVAQEAIYHISCMKHFRLWMPSGKKRGRPIDSYMSENFKKNLRLIGKGYWQWIVHFTRTAFENGGIKWKYTLLLIEEFQTKISGILRISHFFYWTPRPTKSCLLQGYGIVSVW